MAVYHDYFQYDYIITKKIQVMDDIYFKGYMRYFGKASSTIKEKQKKGKNDRIKKFNALNIQQIIFVKKKELFLL